MRVQIERAGRGDRRIYLKSAYSPAIAKMCKEIPGASPIFHEDKFRFWSYPLDYGTCRELRRKFGASLDIGPKLWAWAATERQRADRLETLLSSTAVPLPRVEATEPRLAAAMRSRPYQTVAAAYCATARRALNGDDPGLGKTLETFATVVESGIESGPILVFCPSTAVEATWMREIWEWLPEDDVITAIGNRRQRQEAFRELTEDASQTGRRTWFICNIEMTRVKFDAICPGPTKQEQVAAASAGVELPEACEGEVEWCQYAKRHKQVVDPVWPELFIPEWQAIILDESHKALITTKSQRKKQSQKRVGFGMLKLVDDGLKIALSGTPWRGKPENFWGTLNWLRPDLYTGYWRWAEKFFDMVDDGWSKKVSGGIKPEMEDEWNAELRSVMVRRTKQEKLPGLPPKQYAGTHLDPNDENSLHGIWLEMLPAQAKSYAAMQRDAAVKLADGTIFGNGVLAQMTRLKQFATTAGKAIPRVKKRPRDPDFDLEPIMPSNKFDWLLQFIEEHGILDNIGTSKIVVASQFTGVINLFRAELQRKGVASHCITGQTPMRKRAEQVAEFQSKGGPRIFFINTDAGGVSITLDAADDLVMLDRKWIPDDDQQVEDRLHRASREHQVTIYYLYSLGTIDEYIGSVANTRDDLQKRLLDGARGVAFAKQLVEGK